MARGRTKIGNLNHRDIEAIKIAANFSFITFEEMRDIGISEKRINNFCREENRYFHFEEKLINGRNEKLYFLDKEGVKMARKEGIDNLYSSASVTHDQKLKEYMMKKDIAERESYINERQLANKFRDIIEEARKQKIDVSVADGAYINSSNELILTECITRYYTKEMIGAKENFASLIGARIEYIRL